MPIYIKKNEKIKNKDILEFNYNAYNLEDTDQNFTLLDAKTSDKKVINNVNNGSKIGK